MLDKIKVLASCRHKVTLASDAETVSAANSELARIVQETTEKLAVWLEKRSEAQNVVEQEREKRKYLKTEKWNSMISFHKKKRVLLRHLKKY